MRAMSLLRIADSFYVGVSDLSGAVSWYKSKLGLQEVPLPPMDDQTGDMIAMAFSKKDGATIVLGPVGKSADENTRMLYAPKIKKAHETLSSRGVNAGAIEQDAQGTHYFRIRDVEGNEVEVSEEP